MTTNPQQLMEQMAESYIGLHPDDAYLAAQQGFRDGFMAGQESRDKVLLEGSVQFDEVALDTMLDAHMEKFQDEPAYETVAKWQHSQLTAIYEARIAKLESDYDYATTCTVNAEARLHQELDRKLEALRYCEGRCDQMWAASMVAKLLGGDFRESDVTLTKYMALKGGDK